MKRVIAIAVAVLTCMIPASLRAQSNADSAWAAGNHEVAERLYSARLAADSNDLTALRRIATLRAWATKYPESIALFDRAIRIAPNDTELALERARVLAWARRYEPAIAAVDTILAKDPANRAALQARAQFTSWSGRYEQSLSDYGRLLEINPADPELQIARARVLGWAREYEQAATMYEQMLRNDPGNRDALLGLAQVLSWGGRTDSASVIFRRMLERDPRDLDALKGLARAASWSGDLGTGEQHWRSVIEIAPNDVEGIVGLGATLRWQGRDVAAFDALERAVEIEPNNAEARQQLAYARAAVRTRTAATFTHEADSDKNRMNTATLSVSEYITSNLEVRIQGYARDLSGVDLSGAEADPRRYGQIIDLTYHMDPGWTATVGSNLTNDAIGGLRGRVTTPRWWRVAGSLSYNRAPYDYTAALAERGVSTEQFAADITARLNQRAQLIANAATTRFIGNESNRQVSGALAATYRVLRPLTLGLATRAFTSEKDRTELLEGYFNPDFYGIAELTAAAYHERTSWVFSAETAPGVQKIGSEGDWSASFRITGRAAYVIKPGRQIGASAAYANSGLRQFSRVPSADYNYRAFSVFGNWFF